LALGIAKRLNLESIVALIAVGMAPGAIAALTVETVSKSPGTEPGASCLLPNPFAGADPWTEPTV
jgi:hypothetical protein